MAVTFSFGRPAFVSEVASGAFDAQSVRVAGVVESHDAAARSFALADGGHAVAIDAGFLEALPLRVGSSAQVIGEVVVDPSGRRLVARVARDVTGMDFHLYKEAVKLQRRFLMDDDANAKETRCLRHPERRGCVLRPRVGTLHEALVHADMMPCEASRQVSSTPCHGPRHFGRRDRGCRL
eukprot:scaffold797_cov236-Pinguiococcus_pyrenoidosus.AAC.8